MLFDEAGGFLGFESSDDQRIEPQRDANGVLIGLTGPNGAQLVFGRGTSGQLTDVTDADGNTLAFGYNADGRLVSVAGDDGTASFAYDADGNLTTATTPGDIEAAFGYDTAGRLASASYGGGLQTETFAYGTAGQLTITDGTGRQTKVDLLPGAVAARLSDGSGGIAQLIFAEDGQLTGLRAPDGTETGLAFDEDGRLTTITLTLGAGFDRVEGAVADFFRDTITDFGLEDELVFNNLVFDRDAVDFSVATGELGIDTDGDGVSDGFVALLGDFSGGNFMAVAFEGETTVTFDILLPMLQEGQAVDPELVNGIVNQDYLRGDGATDFRVTLRDLGFAGYDNVLGVYEFTSAGDIVDTRLLINDANADKSAEVTITGVEAGNTLGFFIVQDAADWAAAPIVEGARG
ncbi:hypothetical protein [Sagittula sp. MA-2]|uniref:hypothetical protein n=1 Tax=Sagittula sp. MA-2 TaxID=3048007 RepID=UPI0024C2997C|nr:hypothetical protein [Sagittula sp. MA-2]WHZ37655.1 hypothetical protein QNI11_14235 [Sagittula sp. MA-2]